ncbi:MAG: hypothetical protein OEL89_03035, partial [Candidatus Peregrinibacteria bacterium]|nr:hypothetical protein [Candidatus Peregrinibacteria bacterium]
VFRGRANAKSCLDSIDSSLNAELIYYSRGAIDGCYDVKFCFNVNKTRFCEYSAFLFNCEYCFGCCGLVGKKYHIFNKEYSKEEYFELREKIITKMKETGEYGKFFPGYFAANPYDESLSGFHFPLSKKEQENAGFRVSREKERTKESVFMDVSVIPDDAGKLSEKEKIALSNQTFWDNKAKRPFTILFDDIKFAEKLGVPVPNNYYMNRIQENYSWLFFNGTLRKTKCGKSGKEIETNWPEKYDGRILCEEEYLGILN